MDRQDPRHRPGERIPGVGSRSLMAIMEGTFHAVIGGTQEYVSGGCRLLRGDGIDARGRRGSIFVFISTREVFLSLLAGMSVVAAIKDHGSLYRHGAWRFKDFWQE